MQVVFYLMKDPFQKIGKTLFLPTIEAEQGTGSEILSLSLSQRTEGGIKQ